MNKELMEALDILEKEKNISKDTLLEAIEQSLIQACKNHFGKADNVHVTLIRKPLILLYMQSEMLWNMWKTRHWKFP